jgi:hypothetical protein
MCCKLNFKTDGHFGEHMKSSEHKIAKGPLISEWLFDILDFSKNQSKNLKNFCP